MHGVGDIQFEKIGKPQLNETEVLIEVKAAGICGSDIPRIYKTGTHSMPLIPGHEFSGMVVDVGSKENENWRYKRVGVFPLIPCHSCTLCKMSQHEMCRHYSYLGSSRNGGFAEYVAVPSQNIIELPKQVSYEQAAMLEPMSVAVHAMRRVSITQKDTIAVYGLGTIGVLLIMFLLEHGFSNILAIGNKDYQKEKLCAAGLPEKQYCDIRQNDVKDWMDFQTNGSGANIFFECVGKNETISQAINLTTPGGSICMVGNPYTDITLDKQIYWKILRNQLHIKGTWNSSFFKGIHEEANSDTDWHYVLHLLKYKQIMPEQFISHKLELNNLDKGLRMIRNNSENHLKVMVVL